MRVKVVIVMSVVLLLLAAFPASAAASSDYSAGGFWHKISWGQTVASIGRMYGVSPWAIARANDLVNIDRIWAGTYLWIPTGSAPPPAPPGPTCRTKVTVQWGDTMGDIAWYYGVNVWRLALVNGVSNVNLIYPGQRLCIP